MTNFVTKKDLDAAKMAALAETLREVDPSAKEAFVKNLDAAYAKINASPSLVPSIRSSVDPAEKCGSPL